MVVIHSTTSLALYEHQPLQLTVKAASIIMEAKLSDIHKAELEVKLAITELPLEQLTSYDFTYFKGFTHLALKGHNKDWEKFQDLIHDVL